MNWFSGRSNEDWIHLTHTDEIKKIISISYEIPVVIYKHSSRCGLSFMTERDLQEGWESLKPRVRFYFLDLIRYKDVSASVAQTFDIRHQSPQVLIIKNGQCTYEASHHAIRVDTLLEYL